MRWREAVASVARKRDEVEGRGGRWDESAGKRPKGFDSGAGGRMIGPPLGRVARGGAMRYARLLILGLVAAVAAALAAGASDGRP